MGVHNNRDSWRSSFPQRIDPVGSISNLQPGNIYEITLTEFAGNQEEDIDIIFAGTAPTGIASGSITTVTTETTIEVCWDNPSGGSDLVEITYSPSITGLTPSPAFTENENQRCFTLVGLDPAQQYSITLTTLRCPRRGDCEGVPEADCTTNGAQGAAATVLATTSPNTPGGLNMVYNFQGGFHVDWTGSTGATHYEVTATDGFSSPVTVRVAHPTTEVDITGLLLAEYDVTVEALAEVADSGLVTFSDPSAAVAMTTGAQIIIITGYTSTSISLSGLGSGNFLDYSPSGTVSQSVTSTEFLSDLFPGRLYTITLTNAQDDIIDKVFQRTVPLEPRIIKSYQGVIGSDDQTTFAVVVDGPDPSMSEFDAITVEYNPADGYKPDIQRFDNLQASDLPFTVVFDGLSAGKLYTFFARAYSGKERSDQDPGTRTLVCDSDGYISILRRTSTSIEFTFCSTTGATGYIISLRDQNNNIEATDNNVPANEARGSFMNLDPGSRYKIEVTTRGLSPSVVTMRNTRTLPGEPTGLEIVGTASADAVQLQWTAGAGAICYRITYTGPDGQLYEYGSVCGNTFVTIGDLMSGSQYVFSVYSVSSSAEAYAESSPATVTVQTAISGLQLDQVTSTSITVSWESVTNAVSYLIYYSPEIGTADSPVFTSQTQHTVTGLPQGRFFCIRVLTTVSGSTNEIGRIHGFHIEWKRTIDTNPCPTCWETVGRWRTEYRICDLEPNTEYEVSVFTYIGNAAYNTLSTREVGTATTDPAPTAPYLVLDECSDSIICFRWSVATTNDGSVPNYLIQIKDAITNQNIQTIVAADYHQCCVGNLDSASRFEVTIIPFSSSVTYTPITVATKPSVPFRLHVSVGSGAGNCNSESPITISWTPPDPIDFDFYVVSWQPSTQAPVQLSNDATSYTLSGLQPDTPYTISMYTTVRLDDQVVRSDSVYETARTFPLGELVAFTDTSIINLYVEWGAVPGEASGYQVTLVCPLPPAAAITTESQTVGSSDLLAFEFNNLEPGIQCRLTLTALGISGSNTCDVVVKPLPPQAVTCTDVTRSSFAIEWEEPPSSFFDGYIIEYTPPEGQPMNISPQSSAVTRRVEVTGLNPGTEYTVCVKAYSVTTSDDSECYFKSVTTDALTPNTPQIVVRRCETDFLQITWGDVSNVPGFSRYIVSISPPGTRTGSVTSRQVTYTGLTPGTTYVICVQVEATTDLVEKETTQTRPLTPSSIQITGTSPVALTTTWSQPAQGSCDSYKITATNSDTGAQVDVAVLGSMIRTYVTTELDPSTLYEVCVTCNAGPKSSDPVCAFQQTSGVSVGDIVVQRISDTEFDIAWGRAIVDSDYILQFRLGNQGSETLLETVSVDYGSETFTFTGRTANTVYNVFISQEYNAAAEYASEYVRTDPSPISDVFVDNIMPTTATVSWNDDENCDFYRIKIICRCPNQEPLTEKGIAYPGDNLEFLDKELKPGCFYRYVICKVLSQTSQFPEQSTAIESDEFQAALVPDNTVLGRVCTTDYPHYCLV
ncbi:fibronectin-like [Amphiura filiformis]|uniref:fibronectin-like n=1 Tax=Amphiura filiformis TaxID=82378 RepID=UPI003B218697